MWRPARKGLHVHQAPEGGWRADWPEREGYDIGPPSIAWLTWHIGFWWSMALDHSFGGGTLAREEVKWPGTADAVRQWIQGLHVAWANVELTKNAAEIGYARFLYAVRT